MKVSSQWRIDAQMEAAGGVISRAQALRLGVTPAQVNWALTSGRWSSVHQGVFARSGVPVDERGLVLAACLACGPHAAASHRSAAHLWGLLDHPPSRPSVTVPSARHARLVGIDVHRSRDLDLRRTRTRRGVPVTDPLRTLVDLAAVARPGELDDAVDRARTRRLVTIRSLETEIARLSARGRRGPASLRTALRRRGYIEAPSPSVLESRMARHLRAWGIEVLAVERAVFDGRYRLDFLLRVDVALEVDGYAYHSSPEAKAADARRRAELAAAGILVIEADWVMVMRRPEELRARIEMILANRPVPDGVRH